MAGRLAAAGRGRQRRRAPRACALERPGGGGPVALVRYVALYAGQLRRRQWAWILLLVVGGLTAILQLLSLTALLAIARDALPPAWQLGGGRHRGIDPGAAAGQADPSPTRSWADR